MCKPHLFASTCPASRKSHRYIRRLSLALCLFLFCFSLFSTISPASGARQTHGCAPETPPPVSGNPVAAPATPGSILINEVLSNPASAWNCSEPPGSHFSQITDSWVEIYNPQNQPFNLYATHTEISIDGGSSWDILPFGSAIASHGFLVVFPMESRTVAPPSIWQIVLAFSNAVIDQFTIPEQEQLLPDQSYARVPDGSSTWLHVGQPTIDASNNASGQPVTPAPTQTSTPTKTPKGVSTNKPDPPASSGTQPPWNQVQFPPGATTTPGSTTTPDSATTLSNQPHDSSTTQSSGANGWIGVVIVSLSLMFLAALVCIWRLFHLP